MARIPNEINEWRFTTTRVKKKKQIINIYRQKKITSKSKTRLLTDSDSEIQDIENENNYDKKSKVKLINDSNDNEFNDEDNEFEQFTLIAKTPECNILNILDQSQSTLDDARVWLFPIDPDQFRWCNCSFTTKVKSIKHLCTILREIPFRINEEKSREMAIALDKSGERMLVKIPLYEPITVDTNNVIRSEGTEKGTIYFAMASSVIILD